MARDTGLQTTSLSSASIASNLVTHREIAQMTQRGLLVYSVAKTTMSPSIAQKRCASNATKLVIKQETAPRLTLSDAKNATM